jgi:hypothetical protein
MAYTSINFKTKKILKEAVATGKKIEVYNPGIGNAPTDGVVYLEGPHFPEPHTWYAKGVMKNGFLVKVS